MARLIRLSLLAPEIVGAIMVGRRRSPPATITRGNLMEAFALGWKQQRVL